LWTAAATRRRHPPYTCRKAKALPDADREAAGSKLAALFVGAPGTAQSLGGVSRLHILMGRSDSEAQGRHRVEGSVRSVEQRREPMNKNRIRGLRRRTSEHMIAKSTTIKDAGGRFGRCALKAVVLMTGGLLHCPGTGTETEVIPSDRAAEVSLALAHCITMSSCPTNVTVATAQVDRIVA